MLAIIFLAIDPILFSLGPIDIRWYGLAYAIGIILGFLLIKKLNSRDNKQHLPLKVFDDLFVYTVLGIVIGGRLGYVIFYHPEYLIHDILKIFKTWDGGMSFHGGIIGVICAIGLMCRKHRINFFYIMDLISCAAPIGLFFGRIANFINAELAGRVTNVPWAVIFPGETIARHPSQLYEAFTEGFLLFFILLITYSYTNAREKPGTISGLFLLCYAIARFSIEYFREPDYHIGFVIYNCTMGQILTIPMLLAGIALLYLKRRNSAS